MGQVAETYFSERCLEMLDSLDDEGLVITRDGVPYAKVVRLDPDDSSQRATPHLYGAQNCTLEIVGDIDAPAHRWDAGKDELGWTNPSLTCRVRGVWPNPNQDGLGAKCP